MNNKKKDNLLEIYVQSPITPQGGNFFKTVNVRAFVTTSMSAVTLMPMPPHFEGKTSGDGGPIPLEQLF